MRAAPPPSGCLGPAGSRQRGFTLLEVMCAFAMLSLVISLMVTVWSKNIDTAIWAIDKREMREVADTIFGRILFEQQEHRDGDQNTLAIMYGQWAHLPQHRAERYEDYRYSLSKVEYIAAGASDTDDGTEVIGGTGSEDDTTTASEDTSDEDAAKGSVRLIKFTMKVFKTDEPDNPLITLTRFLRPPDIGVAGTGASTGTGTGTNR
jgi:prepilin-type N-terminal cleavage/methylation domain-containing protein